LVSYCHGFLVSINFRGPEELEDKIVRAAQRPALCPASGEHKDVLNTIAIEICSRTFPEGLPESSGHYETDVLGNYRCKSGGKNFSVRVDFAGRCAQLRYCVARPEFKGVHPLSQFGLERAMGFGLGNWDYIVEENVDSVFSLFAEVVQFSFDLPDRIRAANQ
jgi:hypothetical protein